MKEPLVSIIVPIYNAEKYLDECLKSIINQSYGNIEMILIDDGSSDKSPQICDNYAKKDKRIKVIHKKNGGVSSARNDGICNAVGEFVIFVDSDDTIDKDSVEKLLRNIGDCDILISNLNIDGSPMTCNIHSKVLDKFEKKNFIDSALYVIDGYNKNVAYNPGKMVKLSLINDNNVRYNTKMKYGEDTLFFLTLFSKTDKIFYLNDHFYNYRIVDDSASHRVDSFFFDKLILFYNNIMASGLVSRESLYLNIVDETHKNCLRHFFRESAMYESYCNYIKKDIVQEALKNVKYGRLKLSRRITVFLLRHRLYFFNRLYYLVYIKVIKK